MEKNKLKLPKINTKRSNHSLADYDEESNSSESESESNFERKKKKWNLDEWDPKTFKPDSSSLIIGKRRTGKSYFARWLCHKVKQHYPLVIVMTKTVINGWWEQCVSTNYIYDDWQPHIVRALIKRNRDILTNKELKDQLNPNVLIILDDIIGENSFRNDPTLADLFTLGRHCKIGFILLTQYVYGVGPLARGNCDYIFSCMQTQNRQRTAIAEDYGDIMDKKDFYQLLDENTEDNSLLVIDLSKNSHNYKKVFSRVKANNPGPFVLGDKSCWQSDEASQQLSDIYDSDIREERGWDSPSDNLDLKEYLHGEEEEDEEDLNKKNQKKIKLTNEEIIYELPTVVTEEPELEWL
eukprot:gene9343-11466_t